MLLFRHIAKMTSDFQLPILYQYVTSYTYVLKIIDGDLSHLIYAQGACAGARQLEVTINGIGERAGNASLEEVSTYFLLDHKNMYLSIDPVYKIAIMFL